MLDTLKDAGIKLAVVTNKREHMAHALFDELGLSARFTCIIGAGRYPLKPAPEALLAMVAECGGGRAAYGGNLCTFHIDFFREFTLTGGAQLR